MGNFKLLAVGLVQPKPLERRPQLCGYLRMHSTTQPLHHGTGNARKMKPDELLEVELKVVTLIIPMRAIRFSRLQSRNNMIVYNLRIMCLL